MDKGFTLAYERASRISGMGPSMPPFVTELVRSSLRGLPKMYNSERVVFAQTVRRDPTAPGGVRAEGDNLRYAAIVALGASRLDEATQREVLAGDTVGDLVGVLAERAVDAIDLGAAALATWAAAETGGTVPRALVRRLEGLGAAAEPAATVDLSWALTALLAVDAPVGPAVTELADRIMSAQGAAGIFPHAAAARDPWQTPCPRRLLRRPGVPDPGARPILRGERRSARAVGGEPLRGPHRRAARPRGAMVVALRRAHRRGRRGLPGVQRAPARHGSDGTVRTGRGRRPRSPRRHRAGAGLAAHPPGDRWRAGRPAGRRGVAQGRPAGAAQTRTRGAFDYDRGPAEPAASLAGPAATARTDRLRVPSVRVGLVALCVDR